MSDLYIGIMSGTSMDGIDAALCSVSNKNTLITIAQHSLEIPTTLRNTIQSLCSQGEHEIHKSRTADIEFAELSSRLVNELLRIQQLSASEIKAIGSHGQTIRHMPNEEKPYSLQIGNPSIIANLTGITTIADFRMADIAAGGQGAPLVPAFHHSAFAKKGHFRAIINIGGIANITTIPSGKNREVRGYDIGPGNTLLDQWIQSKQKKPFDKNGDWGRSGQILPELLQQLLNDPYIQQKPPKSTGREYFNLKWLQSYLTKASNNPDANSLDADIQRTLIEFTAVSISNGIQLETNNTPCEVYLCGGGTKNTFLFKRLRHLLPNYHINTTQKLGMDPQMVEAAAFAWLAHQTLSGLPGNIPTATGATKHKILGGIYLA